MLRLGFFCILVASSAIQLVRAQAELSVVSVNAKPGEKVVVPIALNAGQNITALQFTLEFAPHLLSIPSDRSTFPGELLADHDVAKNLQSGKLAIMIFSGSLSKLKADSGAVLQVVFEVSRSASPGSGALVELSTVQASDVGGDKVPIVARSGMVRFSDERNRPGKGRNELVFPQIANGALAGGTFKTSLIFVNRTETAVTAELSFFKSDATDFLLALADGRRGSRFEFTVAARGSTFLQTDGTGGLSSGYARLIATGPLGGTILFHLADGSGRVLTEAGVGAVPVQTKFSIPVLYRKSGVDTGIALTNVTSEQIELVLKLVNKEGQSLATESFRLAGGEHAARYSSQLFALLSSLSEFEGTIEVSAPAPAAVAAVALKQLDGLLSELQADIGAGDLASPGRNPVTVVNPPGAGGISNSKDFLVYRSRCPGDANGDNIRDLLDVSRVVRHALNLQSLTAQQATEADLDANGSVEVGDLVRLIRHLLETSRLPDCR